MLVSPQYSSHQRREVTTYMVTMRDRGTLHCSIQQAIDKADPYSRIVLAGGQYFESITLMQPLEIVGEEGGEMPEISGRGVCVSVVGDVECYFENLKIVTKVSPYSKSVSSLGSNSGKMSVSAIRISSGRPTFHKCEMTSIFVGGDAAPTISKCLISGNVQGCGLIVAEAASGNYRDNTICNHIPFAVHVKTRGTPQFEENSIYQDPKVLNVMVSGAQVDFSGGALLISPDNVDSDDATRSFAPRFYKNKIGDEVALVPYSLTSFDCQTATEAALNGDFEQFTAVRRTVVVETHCSPHLEENIITGGHVCVTFATGSSGTMLNNTISRGSLLGVFVGNLSRAVVRFNVITKCATGVMAQNTAAILTQNAIKENIGSGLLLLVGVEDRFNMEGNSFVGNDVGVSIRPSFSTKRLKGIDANPGESLLTKNYVCLNRTCGILVLGEGYNATLADLEIGANGKYGVLCTFGAKPLLRNVHFDKGGIGLVSERSAEPTVTQCHFSSQTKAGITVRDRGRGNIFQNSITGFATAGIVIDDGGNPHVKDNHLTSNTGAAISVTHGGIGVIEENKIDMVTTGISISSFGDPIVLRNKINSCSDMGIYVADEGCGTILENEITACAVGVGCSMGGECVVRNNVITACTRFGVVSGEGSRLILEKNLVDGNIGGNILIEGRDNEPTITNNRVVKSSGFGIKAIRSASGVVRKNYCFENREGGLSTESDANTAFLFNTAYGERGSGIVIRKDGEGYFEGNECDACDVAGIELYNGANATIVGGVSRNNKSCGILLHSGAEGCIEKTLVEKNLGPGVLLSGISCFVKTHLENLHITHNKHCGIELHDLSSGRCLGCRISNHDVGAVIECAGEFILEDCVFEKNVIGVSLFKKGIASAVKCTFREQFEADVEFKNEGSGVIRQCHLGEYSKVGVLGSFNGAGTVVDSVIRGCVFAGAHFLKGSTTSIESTVVEECDVGIICSELSQPLVQSSTIRKCLKVNVHLLPASIATFTKNLIELSRSSGTIVETRYGLFSDNIIARNEEHGIYFTLASLEGSSMAESTKSAIPPNAASVGRGGAKFRAKAKAVSAFGVPSARELTLQGNTIEENEQAGVYFFCDTTVELYRNIIRKNLKTGLFVCSGACPRILDGNEIESNKEAGVVLAGGSGARFYKCRLQKNDPANFLLQPQSAGTIEECDLGETPSDGIQSNDSLCQIKRSHIHHCLHGSGVMLLDANKYLLLEANEIVNNNVGVSAVTDRASATLQRNVFRHNVICGVRIEDGGCPTVTENTFEQGSVGVLLKTGAAGILTGNQFSKNVEALLISGQNITTTSSQNTFQDNGKGVVLRLTDNIVVEGNTFGENDNAAVCCEDEARPVIRNNKFRGGSRGILCTSTSAPHILQNLFAMCKTGIEISGRSSTRLERCGFTECDIGCKVNAVSSGVQITQNCFHQCSIAGLQVEKQASPNVSRCVFTNCNSTPTSCGLLLSDHGAGTFVENDFHINSIAVSTTKASVGEIQRSMFHDNTVGMQFDTDSQTVVDRCTFFANFTVDVFVRGGASPTVKNSFFTKSSLAVQLGSGANATIASCTFRECVVSVQIEDCGYPSISGCSISNGGTAFLLKKGPSKNATVTRCLVASCEIGVHCHPTGSAQVNQNFFQTCEQGVILEKKSQLKFSNNTIQKASKNGIVIRGNGFSLLSTNVVQECVNNGLLLVIPQSSADDAGSQPTTILENVFCASRSNVQLNSGEVTMRRNHVLRGDFGITIMSDVKGTFEGNVVYDCMRSGTTLGSRHCIFTNNLFYSLNEVGAFEVTSDVAFVLPKDNNVYNHCGCKLAQPASTAPLRVSEVDASSKQKDILPALQSALCSLHTTELPEFACWGCTAIPGSLARIAEKQNDASAQDPRKKSFRRASNAVIALAGKRRSLSESTRSETGR